MSTTPGRSAATSCRRPRGPRFSGRPVGVLLALACLGAAAPAAAQQAPPKGSAFPRPWAAPGGAPAAAQASPLTAVPLFVAAADTVAEAEPNDTPAQAQVVALGTLVTGTISPSGDVDFFAVDVASDTILELEVYASRGGSSLDPVLFLLAADGETMLAMNDDFGPSLDSRLRYRVRTPGRFYVGITDLGGRGGSGMWYRLNVTAVAPPAPGPGDPLATRATGLGYAMHMAAGAAGELYAVDMMGRLLRISPDWQVTEVASVPGINGVAVDGVGDVLVTLGYEGEVRRYSPSGHQTFATGLEYPGSITLGPDGDVYVMDAGRVRRYGPAGNLKATIQPGNVYPYFLAVSPEGVLHATNAGPNIYRLTGNQWTVAATLPQAALLALAFDADGYLYVGSFEHGVRLFDPQLADVGTFSSGSDAAVALVFARNAQGGMTSRLFGIHMGMEDPTRIGVLEEFNPAGLPRLGLRIGTDHLRISTAALRAGKMGGLYADTLRAEGLSAPSWSIEGGSLPAGLALEGGTGILSGIPAASGEFWVAVRVESGGASGYQRLGLHVTRPIVALYDAASHLLGAQGVLGEDLLRFLDLQGNGNGRYDVGDFRAFVRSQDPSAAQLPAEFQHLMEEN